MHDFHGASLPFQREHLRCPSWGGQGKFESLTLGLDGTNPRFPWKPSVTMLTYRLTGTTEQIGITTTNPTSLRPSQHRQQAQPAPNLRAPWCASTDGAALLICKCGSPQRVFTR
jgi:hypothetical protein